METLVEILNGERFISCHSYVQSEINMLMKVADKFGFKLNFEDYDYGGDRYIRTNEVLPDSASDELRKFDSIFLGCSDY